MVRGVPQEPLVLVTFNAGLGSRVADRPIRFDLDGIVAEVSRYSERLGNELLPQDDEPGHENGEQDYQSHHLIRDLPDVHSDSLLHFPNEKTKAMSFGQFTRRIGCEGPYK
jgi:hypothetical protein